MGGRGMPHAAAAGVRLVVTRNISSGMQMEEPVEGLGCKSAGVPTCRAASGRRARAGKAALVQCSRGSSRRQGRGKAQTWFCLIKAVHVQEVACVSLSAMLPLE